MRFLQFVLQLMIALTFAKFVMSGDKIIEDVDKEKPETLEGIPLIEVQGNKTRILGI